MTREQLQKAVDLGQVRNANRVLSRLCHYLHSYRDGYQTIYYLNAEGRDYVGCDKVRTRSAHVPHILLRNDVWLHFKMPKIWKNEVRVKSNNGGTLIIPDSMFQVNGLWNFLEVDRKQTMKENLNKIKRYANVWEQLYQQFLYYPTVVWVTESKLRREKLDELCREHHIKAKVYLREEVL